MTVHPSVLWYSTDPVVAKVRLILGRDAGAPAAVVEPAFASVSMKIEFWFDPERKAITAVHMPGPVPNEDELCRALSEPITPKDLLCLSEFLEQLGNDNQAHLIATLPVRLLRLRQRLQECTIVLDPRRVA
jgi:hypothetical protein